jgi:hypothetical protein
MTAEIATSSVIMPLVYFSALLGLFIAIFTDHLQTIAKYRGAKRDSIASGYNQAMKIMVLNRIGAVLYFLFLSFSIDNGVDTNELKFGLGAVSVICAVPVLLTFLLLDRKLPVNNIYRVINLKNYPFKIMMAVFIATIFNILGLTIPWIAASIFPDLRLTLANTSFLFNTIFTVINVFYIEQKLASIIDTSHGSLENFTSGLIIARAGALAVAGSSLLVFL